MSGADRKVLIPMVGQVESFNLAAAAAIIVAETAASPGPHKYHHKNLAEDLAPSTRPGTSRKGG